MIPGTPVKTNTKHELNPKSRCFVHIKALVWPIWRTLKPLPRVAPPPPAEPELAGRVVAGDAPTQCPVTPAHRAAVHLLDAAFRQSVAVDFPAMKSVGQEPFTLRGIVPWVNHLRCHSMPNNIAIFNYQSRPRDSENIIDNSAEASRGWRDGGLRLSKGTA
jgi:hypothetical protein